MRKRLSRLGAVVAMTLTAGAVWAVPSQADHQTVIGLRTNNTLAYFSIGHPHSAEVDTAINFPAGATDTDLVGIDYRPRSGQLYAVASGGTLYTLRTDPAPATTATATQVGATPAVDPLPGDAMGMDFDPVTDTIRVITDTGANVRLNPTNGEVVATDTPLNAAQSVVGLGYTNSYSGAATTTLYGIDAANDTLIRQGGENGDPSPNVGPTTTIGELGVDTTGTAGLDIETSFLDGVNAANFALAALTPSDTPNQTHLYRVSLSTGQTTHLGAGPIGGGLPVESITLRLTTVATPTPVASQVDEGAGTAKVTVIRTGPGMDRAATVSFVARPAGGPNTASAADFQAVGGELTFAPGVATATASIPITEDAVDEGNENFAVDFTAETSSVIVFGPLGTATVTILDNDEAAPALRPLLSAPAQSVRKALNGVRASFSCTRACSANLSLFAGKRKLSSTAAGLGAAGVRDLRFKIDAADRRVMLNRVGARGLELKIKGVFRSGGRTVRRTLTFRAHL